MSSITQSRRPQGIGHTLVALSVQAAATLTQDRRKSLLGRRPAGLLTGAVAGGEAEIGRKKMRDTQIVQEFRSKLRVAEEMVSKLAFNLREIQGLWNRTPENENVSGTPAAVIPVGKPDRPRD